MNLRDFPASCLLSFETPLLQFNIRRDNKTSPSSLIDNKSICPTSYDRRTHNFRIGLEIHEDLTRVKSNDVLQSGPEAVTHRNRLLLTSMEAWDFILQ